MLCDGKEISLRLSLLSSCHLDLLVRDDPREEKESLQFCGFLYSVYCIPSRTVYTERTYSQPQSGSGACGLIEKEDLVVNKVLREWVVLDIFNTVNDD